MGPDEDQILWSFRPEGGSVVVKCLCEVCKRRLLFAVELSRAMWHGGERGSIWEEESIIFIGLDGLAVLA